MRRPSAPDVSPGQRLSMMVRPTGPDGRAKQFQTSSGLVVISKPSFRTSSRTCAALLIPIVLNSGQ